MSIYLKAKTAVFWDTEGCPIPQGLDVVEASQNIRESLTKVNYLGETSIYVYGDTEQIKAGLKSPKYEVKPHEIEHEVIGPQTRVIDYRGTASIYAGEIPAGNPKIVVNHTPAGQGDAKHVKILADFLCWPLDNDEPANLILIVGSLPKRQMFKLAFSRLSNLGYNVLVALPENVPARKTGLLTNLHWEDLSLGNCSAGESSQLERKDPPT